MSTAEEYNYDQEIAGAVQFEDFLPEIAEKLGGDGLMRELCKGFEMLKDPREGVITLESLRTNSAELGLQDMGDDDELIGMLREGDLDGDGTLDLKEFCVLMFRLSPQLMERATYMIFAHGSQLAHH
ncbi:Calcium-binding EF-hand family protein [Zostera marina]|uniref:Calcium-binding EF-hand family protein n=1 Tax=Zostera marina TaxID=29655 RepID=A0A0K9NN49_ZOSMR|nr:Calcium-binding EF-hand family protein [Zostera marina]